jgi:hypothetical protein
VRCGSERTSVSPQADFHRLCHAESATIRFLRSAAGDVRLLRT